MQEFIGAIPSRDKTLRVVEGGYHELLMGEHCWQHAQAISDWILKQPSSRL